MLRTGAMEMFIILYSLQKMRELDDLLHVKGKRESSCLCFWWLIKPNTGSWGVDAARLILQVASHLCRTFVGLGGGVVGLFCFVFCEQHFWLIFLRTGTLGCLFEVKNNSDLDYSSWLVNGFVLLSVDLSSDRDFIQDSWIGGSVCPQGQK